MRFLLVLTVLGALSAPAAAQIVVNVPASNNSFATIQAAIDAVGPTTPLTIVLGVGTHSQSSGVPSQISLNNHTNLTITSTAPTTLSVVQSTIVDGLGVSTTGFLATGGEDGTTSIEGITIRRMVANGVTCANGGSPRIRWCQIWDNGGAGVRCADGSTSNIKLIDFRGNASSGVRCVNSSAPTIDRCQFSGNGAVRGGGVASKSGSLPTITKSDFVGNSASDYGGAVSVYGASAIVEDCEILDNGAGLGGGGIAGEYGTDPELSGPITVKFCDVQGGAAGMGNISVDPLFDASYCPTNAALIDAGDDTLVPNDVCDIDRDLVTAETLPLDLHGTARIIDTVDMGACEQ